MKDGSSGTASGKGDISTTVLIGERAFPVFRVPEGCDRELSDRPRLGARSWPLVLALSSHSPEEPTRRWRVEAVVDAGGAHLDPEYWLRNCQGFLVDSQSGQHVGVVEDVDISESGEPLELVVASGWFGRRRRRLSIADVEAIIPRERRLVVGARLTAPGARS